jgi:hypothetical protein
MEKTITFDDIMEDSLINPMEGDSLYAFTKEVEVDTVEVGDKLEMDDIHKEFSQTVDDVTVEDSHVQEQIEFDAVGISPISQLITSEIGTITLSDIPKKPTSNFIFYDIFPDINNTVLFPDGIHPIPSISVDVEDNYAFDDFSNAAFTNGNLILTIANYLVIPLGETNIQLKSEDGTEILGNVTIDGPINPESSKSGELNLSGINLPESIIVSVTSLSLAINDVEINDDARDSYFNVIISGEDLEVSSATAKLPAQTIVENSTIQLSSADSNIVESATIFSGKLIVSIDNNMEVTSAVNLNIPTIHDPLGAPFQVILDIQPLTTGILNEYSLNNYSLEMNLEDQSVYYDYTVETEDTGDDLVTISSTDDIVISISLEGENSGEEITFSQFTGRVAPQDLGFDGTIDLDSDSEIHEAVLGNGLLEIVIQNDVNQTSPGAPTAVLTIPELRTPEGLAYEVTLDHFYGSLHESINLSGFSLLPNYNQQLSYNADVTTQYEEIGSYSLNNSISVNINVTDLSFNEVRGFFSQDAMVDSNSITIDDDTKIETATVKTGEMVLAIANNIGIVAEIEFTILEFIKNGSILDTTLALSPAGGSYSIDLANYQLELDMEADPQTVNYVSTINLPDDEEMTLSLNDSIRVDVTLSNFIFESVTGDIEPITVDIDPVVQKIDGLPDEVEDFEFTEVNMFIDFDTDIGISVVLDLVIEASKSSGEVEISTISGWDITEDNRVIIPNAESLINIFPDTIRASGEATVSGLGTVTTSQYVSGLMTVEAPLSFHVPDDTEVDVDIQETDLELDDEVLEEVVVFFDAENQFDFGTSISVYTASDSTLFGTNEQDLLFSVEIPSNEAHSDSVVLDNEKIVLFSGDKLFVNVDVTISGKKDENGNSEPSQVLTTDSLNMTIFGRIEMLVDNSE